VTRDARRRSFMEIPCYPRSSRPKFPLFMSGKQQIIREIDI